MRRFFSILLALLPSLFVPAVLLAQVDPGNCPTCYQHFVDDRSLHIGGHQISDDSAARNRFHMSFSQEYGQNPYDIAAMLYETSMDVVWIATDTVPWGGYWNDTVIDPSREKNMVVNGSGNEPLSIERFLKRDRYLRLLQNGMKVSLHPEPIYDILKGAGVRESYLAVADRVKRYLHCDRQPDEPTGDFPDLVE